MSGRGLVVCPFVITKLDEKTMKDKLVTKSYVCILAANFLLYFGFWILMPVLPFYLTEVFGTSETVMGAVLSSYTIAALCIRPFSGYLLDTFSRKPLYLLAYFVFTAVFGGYLLAGTLTLFILLRIIHGLSFGMVTVSGNTVVIDIMPSSRRGEGLGYYGLSNNIAMSIGPMTGLFLHDTGVGYPIVFACSLASCVIGLVCALSVKTVHKPPVKREPVSLDRFILIKGIPAGISLLLLSIPLGMVNNYMAMYLKQIGIQVSAGFFFTFLAMGMAVSRIFSGRLVDRGMITQVIEAGLCLVCFCFIGLGACGWLDGESVQWIAYVLFGIALLLGIGFGTMFPAYNTLFVNLAPHNLRGTATGTYLTCWDVGVGVGLFMGGYIAEIADFRAAYLVGAVLTVISLCYFRMGVAPHFHRNRLR